MHIAPVVLIPHAVRASGWVAAVTILAECLARHPGLTVTVVSRVQP